MTMRLNKQIRSRFPHMLSFESNVSRCNEISKWVTTIRVTHSCMWYESRVVYTREQGPAPRNGVQIIAFHRGCLLTPTWIRKSGTTSSRTDWPDCWRSRVNNHLTPCAARADRTRARNAKWRGGTWLRSEGKLPGRRTLNHLYSYFFTMLSSSVYITDICAEKKGIVKSKYNTRILKFKMANSIRQPKLAFWIKYAWKSTRSFWDRWCQEL